MPLCCIRTIFVPENFRKHAALNFLLIIIIISFLYSTIMKSSLNCCCKLSRIIFLIFVPFCFATPTIITTPQSDDTFVWNDLLNVSTEAFQSAFLPNYVDFRRDVLGLESTVSTPCKTALYLALNSLTTRQYWAVKLFNSWAKFPPSGTMRGTLTDFGDYDQCLSIESAAISPQYCLVDIAIPMPKPMPESHNYHHKAKVLPHTERELARLSHENLVHLSNGSFYQYLADVSSVFYYAYIQIGICLPEQCEAHDAKIILERSRR